MKWQSLNTNNPKQHISYDSVLISNSSKQLIPQDVQPDPIAILSASTKISLQDVQPD